MEEIKNKMVKVELNDCSLAVTKGYEYVNKEKQHRYTYNDTYYSEDGKITRKYSNDKGDFYYNVELIDVIVETFPKKDGTMGSKTYPLSEVPYLAASADEASEEVLKNYLAFKLHR